MSDVHDEEASTFVDRRGHGAADITCDEQAAAAWSDDAPVIAVDVDGREIAFVSRDVAHRGEGILHRAFMTLLWDEHGRLMLARRSEHKRLWPMIWADSCAGHPLPGETVVVAARRRAAEELGCDVHLHTVGSFVYEAQMGDAGLERELCEVCVGTLTDELQPNPAEVSEIAFFYQTELDEAVRQRPDDFAPWLVACLDVFPISALAPQGGRE